MFITAEKYDELKSRLQNAMKKKDADELDSSLKAFEKRIPENMLTDADKNLVHNAQEKLQTLEANKSNEKENYHSFYSINRGYHCYFF